jgi:hypothetical protein
VSAPNANPDEAAPPRLPPARSGTTLLIGLSAGLLLFLGALWYASFVALEQRGPDRAFLTKESWVNGTLVLAVSALDVKGEVPFDSLTVKIVASSGATLFEGPLNATRSPGNYSLSVRVDDRDGSGTLTLGDAFNITADPAEATGVLVLTNFYLLAGGQEWARWQID